VRIARASPVHRWHTARAYAGHDDYRAVTVDEIPVVVLEPIRPG
jgi:hypothetical protein